MKTDSSKSTILVISMGFLLIYVIFSFKWALIVSLIIGLTGILSSSLCNMIAWGWMKLSQLLGYIIPNILLSLVFFLFLFPISVISKLFSNDPLMLSTKYESYFVEVNKEFNKNNFEKIW